MKKIKYKGRDANRMVETVDVKIKNHESRKSLETGNKGYESPFHDRNNQEKDGKRKRESLDVIKIEGNIVYNRREKKYIENTNVNIQ